MCVAMLHSFYCGAVDLQLEDLSTNQHLFQYILESDYVPSSSRHVHAFATERIACCVVIYRRFMVWRFIQ